MWLIIGIGEPPLLYCLCVLITRLAFIFLNNAVSVGVLTYVPLLCEYSSSLNRVFEALSSHWAWHIAIENSSFVSLVIPYSDSRSSFLPASLVSSILYFSLEVYAIARMMLLLSSNAQMRQIIRDNRVVRPVALIFVSLLQICIRLSQRSV